MVFRRFFPPWEQSPARRRLSNIPAPVRLLSPRGRGRKKQNFEKGAHKMGLIKAALAAGGVMADQWKEYFYCEAIPENVMAVRGCTAFPAEAPTTKVREHHLQRLRCGGCRWTVHDHRRSGQGHGALRGTRRVRLRPRQNPRFSPASWYQHPRHL